MTFDDVAMAETLRAIRTAGIGGPFAGAIVLGTGLGGLAEAVEDAVSLPYAAIPHFPRTGVSGHGGRLVAGRLEGRRVLVFQGRVHAYEQGDAAAMRVPIATLAALGAPPLILTNAAGSTFPDCAPGGLGLITDHINAAGLNPLFGLAGDARFVSMNDAYNPALRARLKRAAIAAGVRLTEGIYMWFSGPSFETPAEIRMARLLGADFVGMSTAPEVILARYHGLNVAALSLVTNWAAGHGGGAPSHAETQRVAAAGAADTERVLRAFLRGGDDG